MAENKSTNPYTPEFQPSIKYGFGDLPPQVVASTTADIFGLCLDNGLPHGDESLNFLQKQSLPFVGKISAGIDRYPLRVEYATRKPVEELVLLVSGNEVPTIPYDESREALDFALIVMGRMPEKAALMFGKLPGINIPVDFSKSGMFRMPTNISETKQRVHELGIQVLRGILRETSGSSDIFNNPGQARARLFFHTAKDLKLINPDEQKGDRAKNFPDYYATQYVQGE